MFFILSIEFSLFKWKVFNYTFQYFKHMFVIPKKCFFRFWCGWACFLIIARENVVVNASEKFLEHLIGFFSFSVLFVIYINCYSLFKKNTSKLNCVWCNSKCIRWIVNGAMSNLSPFRAMKRTRKWFRFHINRIETSFAQWVYIANPFCHSNSHILSSYFLSANKT